jgi:ankyrin repeat protein
MRITALLASVFLVGMSGHAAATPADQEALCTAARSGSPADIEALIKKGAKVDGYCKNVSDSALGTAMTVARVDNMEALLNAGPKAGGSKSHVPLAYARNAASAELLLKHGARVNAIDKLGNTPLLNLTSTLASNFPDFYQMTEQDAVDIAKLLIAHGAKVNFADKYGGTALIEASFACLPNLVALLIDNGADVNARSSTQTGLARLRNVKDMNPTECGQTEQVLLAHGATE